MLCLGTAASRASASSESALYYTASSRYLQIVYFSIVIAYVVLFVQTLHACIQGWNAWTSHVAYCYAFSQLDKLLKWVDLHPLCLVDF